MANEFKIRKGLIVEGATGGTVVDVQGSLGQLFSVTDNLSGEIFAVADISGVPIMSVNSSGVSYFDGKVGIGTASPTARLMVKDSSDSGFDSGIAIIRSANTQTGYINMVGGAMNINSPSIPIAFRQAGSVKTIILNNGNVGIGLTNPNYKLSVANATTRIISATYIDGQNGIMSHAGSPNFGLESLAIRGDFINFFTDYDASHFQGVERMRITAGGGISFGSSGTAYGTSGQVLTSAGNASPTWQDNGSGDISGSGAAGYVTKFTGTKTIGNGPIFFNSNSIELLQPGVFNNSSAILYNGTAAGGTGTTVVQYMKIFDKVGNANQQYLHFELLSVNNSEYSAEVKVIVPAYSGFSSSYGTMDDGMGVQVEITYGGLAVQTSSILSIIEVADLSSVSSGTELYLKIQPAATNTQIKVKDYGDCTQRVLTNQTWSTTAPSYQHREFTFNVGATNINQVLNINRNQKVGIGTISPDAILETSKEVDGNQVGALLTNTRQSGTADSVSLNFGLGRTADGLIFNIPAIKFLKEQQWTGTGSTVDGALVFSTIQNETVSEKMRITSAGELQVTGNGVIRNEHSSANFSYWQQTASDARLFTQYAQPLYFGTNSSIKMTILSGGNVGIGVTNPSEKLYVASTAGFIATFQSTTATDFRPIRWVNSAGQNVGFLGNNGSTNEFSLIAQDRPLRFGTGNGGAERMRISSAGNVGIGTSTPLAKLDVQGTQGQLFSVTDDLSGDIFAVADISGVPIMSINSSGSIKFGSYSGTNQTGTPTFLLGTDASGNVVKTNTVPGSGAGPYLPLSATSSFPLTGDLVVNTQLYVKNGVGIPVTGGGTINAYSRTVSTNLFSALRLWDNTSASSFWDIGATGGTSTLFNFYHNANTTPKISFTHTGGAIFTGNVGIGTTGPTSPLMIAGSGADGTAMLRLEATTAGNTFNWMTSSIYPNLQVGKTVLHLFGHAESTNNQAHIGFKYAGAGSTSNMFSVGFFANDFLFNVLATGNVGIGTQSPVKRLVVKSSGADDGIVLLRNATSGVIASVIETGSGDGALLLANNSAATSVLLRGSGNNYINSGNVGIGNTLPQHKLDVSGTIRATNYRLAGNTTNPTTTAATIYDQASVGLTLSAHNTSFRSYNGSAMVESARLTYDKLVVVGDVIAYGTPSDKRLKENIKPIESALDKVSKLQGVTFDWKKSDSILNIKEDIGFIAQDIQKVLPELVRENKDGMLSMRHQGIAPILLEAIKELKAEIEELKKKIK